MKKLIMLFFTLSACSHLTVVSTESTLATGPSHTLAMDSYLLGTIRGSHVLTAGELCPNAELEGMTMRTRTPDVLLSLITLGIYVPYDLEVRCTH